MLCHAQLILVGNSIGDEGAKALSEALKLNGSLTSLDTRSNGISGAAAQQLADAALGSALEVFGEVPVKQLRADTLTQLSLADKGLGPAEAIVLAKLVSVSGSLTEGGSASATHGHLTLPPVASRTAGPQLQQNRRTGRGSDRRGAQSERLVNIGALARILPTCYHLT